MYVQKCCLCIWSGNLLFVEHFGTSSIIVNGNYIKEAGENIPIIPCMNEVVVCDIHSFCYPFLFPVHVCFFSSSFCGREVKEEGAIFFYVSKSEEFDWELRKKRSSSIVSIILSFEFASPNATFIIPEFESIITWPP